MESKQSFATRLEESFLSILRIVILAVLALSLIGSLFLAFSGASNLNASPKQFEYGKIDKDDFKKELRNLFEEKKPVPAKPAPEKKPENKDLEAEIDKQVKLRGDFLAKYGYQVNADVVKKLLLERSVAFAEEKSDEAALAFAKNRTEFYSIGYGDKALLALVEQRHKEIPDSFDSLLEAYDGLVANYYDQFFEAQQEQKKQFEGEQAGEVMVKKAGAALQLYIAAGLFGAFLIISLILVLVKIERNLRVRPL